MLVWAVGACVLGVDRGTPRRGWGSDWRRGIRGVGCGTVASPPAPDLVSSVGIYLAWVQSLGTPFSWSRVRWKSAYTAVYVTETLQQVDVLPSYQRRRGFLLAWFICCIGGRGLSGYMAHRDSRIA